jgi:hypothetical protein
MDLSKLRARLQEITSTDNIDGHPLAIETLRVELPHSIRLVSLADQACLQNCFEWALGLNRELAHWVGDCRLRDLYAGSKFVQELIPSLVHVPDECATEGDLVLYFDREIPTHAGLIKESEVISKWGSGHTYQHGQLEVPESYGNTFLFYRKPPVTMVEMHFVKYVQCHPDFSVIQEVFEEKFGYLHAK